MNGESESREDLVTDESATKEQGPSLSHAGHGEGHGEGDVASSGEDSDQARPGLEPAAAVPTPPVTGDEAVDDAMMRLAESQTGTFADRIEAGEHAHRSLQSRLGGLGGA
ncbi:hypothetical protein GCM10009868_19840 [Terrabacter aerolatus]|uniref:Uncharacterized protein n=1 Tax=Terrabacter aerolatus TaxID=422442 RepID=A0A512D5D2_9MICO|nr:hypothetical protein [Terrabacter aerolatus]GEO31480.1 hypothetical protein TAE01_32900 [Terrabacter aerolatus]